MHRRVPDGGAYVQERARHARRRDMGRVTADGDGDGVPLLRCRLHARAARAGQLDRQGDIAPRQRCDLGPPVRQGAIWFSVRAAKRAESYDLIVAASTVVLVGIDVVVLVFIDVVVFLFLGLLSLGRFGRLRGLRSLGGLSCLRRLAAIAGRLVVLHAGVLADADDCRMGGNACPGDQQGARNQANDQYDWSFHGFGREFITRPGTGRVHGRDCEGETEWGLGYRDQRKFTLQRWTYRTEVCRIFSWKSSARRSHSSRLKTPISSTRPGFHPP